MDSERKIVFMSGKCGCGSASTQLEMSVVKISYEELAPRYIHDPHDSLTSMIQRLRVVMLRHARKG